MLKYTLKPNIETNLTTFPISEFFVSPDLQYISGVTDYNVGLVNGESVIIRGPYLIGNENNTINVENVKRQGKVKVVIELPVKNIIKKLNFPIYYEYNPNRAYIITCNQKYYLEEEVEDDYVFAEVSQNYIEYNGDISYFFNGDTSGYLIDNKFYSATSGDTVINFETYMYIENGELHVGEKTYYADFATSDKPILRLDKFSEPIKGGDVLGYLNGSKCSAKKVSDDDESIIIEDYLPAYWKRITKFYIEKKENPKLTPDTVLYGGYRHYVEYQGNNYFLKDVYDGDVYVGYGVTIDEEFYKLEREIGEFEHKDTLMLQDIVDVNGDVLEVKNSLASFTNGGQFILFIDSVEDDDIQDGNYIVATSHSPLTMVKQLFYDEENDPYILYCDKKYYVKEHMYDTVNVSGKDYLLNYLDGYSSASTIINGETIYFDINGDEAKLSNKVYYKDPSSTDSKILIKYGINERPYNITEGSGVTINGKNYKVDENIIDFTNIDETSGSVSSLTVTIDETVKVTLSVTEVNGSSTYICYPVIKEEEVYEFDEEEMQRELSTLIVENWDSFSYVLRKDTFGDKKLTVENGLMESMSSNMPYTVSNDYLLEKNINIFRVDNYANIKLPLSFNTANNLRREDIVKNDFVDYVEKNVINKPVDMEKDIYYPVWKDANGNLKQIAQLRFNLHFRTRTLDNWKIIEDDREYSGDSTANSEMCNWFILDYSYYKELFKSPTTVILTTARKRLHNSSDLLGFLNFSTSEVNNQASKISKSFLRLSFYSTDNPNTQVLLGTSTIFLDGQAAFKKCIDSKRNSDLIFIDTNAMQEYGYSDLSSALNGASGIVSSNTISSFSELFDLSSIIDESTPHGDYYFNDTVRLSSRINVYDKHNANISSEGFYFYLFKEYSNELHEGTVYLKIEFNHAGIGKTIPLMLPRKKDGKLMYLDNNNDVRDLKKGFKMKDIYKQIYIPINVIFDKDINKYVYYLPKELRCNDTLGVDNEIMEFNLFEVKFENESVINGNRYENNQ